MSLLRPVPRRRQRRPGRDAHRTSRGRRRDPSPVELPDGDRRADQRNATDREPQIADGVDQPTRPSIGGRIGLTGHPSAGPTAAGRTTPRSRERPTRHPGVYSDHDDPEGGCADAEHDQDNPDNPKEDHARTLARTAPDVRALANLPHRPATLCRLAPSPLDRRAARASADHARRPRGGSWCSVPHGTGRVLPLRPGGLRLRRRRPNIRT
jgi:hypothetical protein